MRSIPSECHLSHGDLVTAVTEHHTQEQRRTTVPRTGRTEDVSRPPLVESRRQVAASDELVQISEIYLMSVNGIRILMKH